MDQVASSDRYIPLEAERLRMQHQTVWNALPEDVKKSNNVESFKKLLKSHYFKLAYGK